MLGTYAIGLVIREIVRGLLGGNYRSIQEPISGYFTVGGIEFSWWRSVVIVTTMLVMALSLLIVRDIIIRRWGSAPPAPDVTRRLP